MIFPLALVGLGWVLAKRGAPKTAIRQAESIGSFSGNRYRVEEVVGTGTMVVEFGGTRAVLRALEGRWHILNATGDRAAIKQIEKDFNVADKAEVMED